MSLVVTESYEIEAKDPGDIVVVFRPPNGPTLIHFPLKALTVDKTIDITPEYGTGSHLSYQLTPGKIGFSGSFKVGTFVGHGEADDVRNERVPGAEKESFVKMLTDQGDEGLPLYFSIEVHDRKRTEEGEGGEADALIEKYTGCMLSGDGIDIGEPGTTSSRSYPFVAMRRSPK